MEKNYYIFKSGEIQRKDNSLVFRFTEDGGHKYLPIEGVESLYLFGEVNFNTKLVNFLAQNDVMIHFFNYYGFYTASMVPKTSLVSGFTLVHQVTHYSDLSKRLILAKHIIHGAAYNILANLKYYNTKNRDLAEKIESIKALVLKIDTADTIPGLMGIEGNIRAIYYQAFNEILVPDLGFTKRVRRPPKDIVNVLISFLNSMVYTTCLGEIYKTQLNPTVSFLHEPSSRRFSLSLDIAEIFKPLIADRLIFSLLNKGQITESDFLTQEDFLILSESGKKTIIKAYDEKIATTVKHRQLGRSVSYRYLIRLELYKIIKHVIGEKEYDPFKIYW